MPWLLLGQVHAALGAVRLVAGAQPGGMIAVQVFMEWDVLAPVRIAWDITGEPDTA